MRDAESAMFVREWVGGSTQRHIGKKFGFNSSAVCNHIRVFIEKWCGETTELRYGIDRQKMGKIALSRFVEAGGMFSEPHRIECRLPEATFTQVEYTEAREDHVILLKIEGETFRQIGHRISVSTERARQIHFKAARKFKWRMRHAKFRMLNHDVPIAKGFT